MRKLILGFMVSMMFWSAESMATSVNYDLSNSMSPEEMGQIMEKLEVELGAERLEKLLTPETTEAIEYYINHDPRQIDPYAPYAATPAAAAAGAVGGVVAAAVDYAWERAFGSRMYMSDRSLAEMSDQEFDLVLDYRDKLNQNLNEGVVTEVTTRVVSNIGPVTGTAVFKGGKQKMVPYTFVAPIATAQITKLAGDIKRAKYEAKLDQEFDHIESMKFGKDRDPVLMITGKVIGFGPEEKIIYPQPVPDGGVFPATGGTPKHVWVAKQGQISSAKAMEALRKALGGPEMAQAGVRYVDNIDFKVSADRVNLISETTDIIEAYNHHGMGPISPVAATPAVAAGAAAGALAYNAAKWGLRKAFGERLYMSRDLVKDTEFDFNTPTNNKQF